MARLYGVPKQAGVAVRSNFRIVGLKEALAKIARIDPVCRLEIGQICAAGAIHMKNAAQNNVHVITGNLRSGIKMSKGPGPYTYFVTASSREGEIAEKNDKEYAGYEEFGWSGLPGGHPYMRPAYEETKPLVYADLALFATRLRRELL